MSTQVRRSSLRHFLWSVRGRLLVALFLAVSSGLLGQAATEPSPAQKPPESATQPQSATPAPEPERTLPPAQSTTPPPQGEKIALPERAQRFEFTKVDLELLRQVDAFDKYMEEKGWVYNDPETSAYLDRLGLSLVPKETPENVKWRFHAMRDIEVNAFAMPNGSIYVNSGLISRMENEAQLAGVLARVITSVNAFPGRRAPRAPGGGPRRSLPG